MANRAFKGIWIPAEIWLCKDLTMQEKLFLVEIDSLDNENGCTASNQYFADFFEISKTRVSLVIKHLSDKGFIKSSIIYKEGSKQILNRVLNICRPPYPTFIIDPIQQKLKDPIQQKLKDNNTDNNNTDNNTNNNISGKKPQRHKYGEYSRVLLSDTEIEKLRSEYSNADELISFLDEYCEMNGKSYKNYYLAIKKWVVNAVNEKKTNSRQEEKSSAKFYDPNGI